MRLVERNACRALLLSLGLLAASNSCADQHDPELPELFERLAGAASAAQAQDIERAIWSAWLKVDDARASDLLESGMSAMNGGEISAAISEFDSLVEAAPEFAEAWNKRATVLYMARRFAESVRDIQRTLALEPRHFGALSGMGLIFLQTGDSAGALEAFEAVLEVHPQSPSARQQVERLRRELGTPA